MTTSDKQLNGITKNIVVPIFIIIFTVAAWLVFSLADHQSIVSSDVGAVRETDDLSRYTTTVACYNPNSKPVASEYIIKKDNKATRRKSQPTKNKPCVQRASSDIKKVKELKPKSEEMREQTTGSINNSVEKLEEHFIYNSKKTSIVVPYIQRTRRPPSVAGAPFVIIINGCSQKITIMVGEGVKGNHVTLNADHCKRIVSVPKLRPVHFHLVGSYNIIYVQQKEIFNRMTTSYVGKSNIFRGLPPS